MTTPAMELSRQIPTVPLDHIGTQIAVFSDSLRQQLADWGFMAVNVPGIREHSDAFMADFRAACNSQDPALAAYSHEKVPQISSSGNHGYFPFYSEIPRLAAGVADPKEYMHISGWMINDQPPGAAAVFRSFPRFGASARSTFDASFDLVQSFARVIHNLLPAGSPDLSPSYQSSILRVVRYNNVDGRRILAHEHSGIQMLGIQLPPSDQGLQYILNDGNWVEPILAGTDVVLCNIGRMLAFASGNYLRPSTHRVHQDNPEVNYERLSAVLFVYPDHSARQWTIRQGEVVWQEATWGDFVRDRFRAISRSDLEDSQKC